MNSETTEQQPPTSTGLADGSETGNEAGREILTRLCEDAAKELSDAKLELFKLAREGIPDKPERSDIAKFRVRCATYEKIINMSLKTIQVGHRIGVFRPPRSGGNRQEGA